MNLRTYLVIACCTALLSGCTTPASKPAAGKPAPVKKAAATKPAQTEGTPYVVVLDFTPFYSLGPAQPGGPDTSLRNGEFVGLLKREWGYSKVRLGDERTGYVANESIAPAPPQPKPLPQTSSPTGKKRRGKGSEAYTGEQVNDAPLPDLPPPNLNIAPEDTPDTAPETQSPPVKPGFRY